MCTALGIKEAIGPTPKKSAPLLSASGVVITDPSAQLDQWAEHYSTLYATDGELSSDVQTSLLQLPVLHELDSNISLQAVARAISGLKVNKSSGADGISSEVFRLCWLWCCLPQDLKDDNIITSYKNKGTRHDCNNYRGIFLLNMAGKVLARVLLPRLQVIAVFPLSPS